MSDAEQYEILILGSGEAAKNVAWLLAKEGRRTAIIERGLIGGSCPNIACLPSKNVIYSGRVAALARRGAEFGLTEGPVSVDMLGVRSRKRRMVEDLISVHRKNFAGSGAELIMGEGKFVDSRTIEVSLREGGVRTLTGERVYIGVGTRAAIPNIPGLRECAPLTHVEALELGYVPEHLIVLGGGDVGLEFAQPMRRFGSRVTIVEQGAQLAPREDDDVGAAIRQRFTEDGIAVLVGTQAVQVEGRSGDGVVMHVRTAAGAQSIKGSDLLVAAGRTPNTSEIGLQSAGIEVDTRGYVKVNERLETSARNVWAMGDCAGSPQFTHVGYDDFRVIRDNLRGHARTTLGRLVPYCTFTDPELGRVGLSETAAKKAGVAYRVAKVPLAAVLHTRTTSEPFGFLKALIAADSDLILGFAALGEGAGDLAAIVQTAMLADAPFTVLRDALFSHPTMAEGFTVLFATEPLSPQLDAKGH